MNRRTFGILFPKANAPIVDWSKSIVALNFGSTKGISQQLMNEAGQPIALDTACRFNDLTTTWFNFKIRSSAAYYRLGNEELGARSASTEVTFIVNYLRVL